jgi:hypothetical protein
MISDEHYALAQHIADADVEVKSNATNDPILRSQPCG